MLEESGKRVLVVEDEPDILTLVLHHLSSLGYETTPATCVDEALALLGQTAFDLLFTDVALPRGEGGLDLAEWARANRPSMPVLLTSGNPPPSLLSHSAPNRPPLLRKPYRRQALVQALTETLARAA